MGTQKLTPEVLDELFKVLKARFEKNMHRHEGISWDAVKKRLESNSDKLWSLNAMEQTGGEPDVVDFDEATGAYIFYDCSAESPKGRRSACYDRAALEGRKKFPPKTCIMDMADEMGIAVLDETQYRKLQQLGSFDTKTSSWIKTPADIRALGGALFADFRYNTVFVYHNGAESYYAARGFRGCLSV